MGSFAIMRFAGKIPSPPPQKKQAHGAIRDNPDPVPSATLNNPRLHEPLQVLTSCYSLVSTDHPHLQVYRLSATV